MTAPETMNGKKKVFEETFVSPFSRRTQEEALGVLEEIRKQHSEDSGWHEIYGNAKQLSNGKLVAVRHHAKYE